VALIITVLFTFAGRRNVVKGSPWDFRWERGEDPHPIPSDGYLVGGLVCIFRLSALPFSFPPPESRPRFACAKDTNQGRGVEG